MVYSLVFPNNQNCLVAFEEMEYVNVEIGRNLARQIAYLIVYFTAFLISLVFQQ